MVNIRYRIDGRDLIAGVSESWAPFALANGAIDLAQPLVGRSIWDFLSGVTTREIYRELFARVRHGRTVTFPYRCDSPALRRFLRMQLSPAARDTIQFESATISTEPRDPIELVAARSLAAGLVTVCSWCKRVAVGSEWVEVEVAVQRLGLFGGSVPGELAHGACRECVTLVLRDTDSLAAPSTSP